MNMATLLSQKSSAMSVGPIIGRGFAAAHGTLTGAFYLFLLHAPAQVLSAMAQLVQIESMHQPPGASGPALLSMMLSLGNFVLAVVVFFVFPFVLGGILGQVRDRLATPHQQPGSFAAYGRANYLRLLGSSGLYLLIIFVLLAPVICVLAGLVVQAMMLNAEAPPDGQPFARQFLALSEPLTIIGLAVFTALAAIITMVYWIANCMLVSTSAGVFACWRQSLRFARHNVPAWLAVWFLIVAVSCLIAPVGLATQLGWVTNSWEVVALALLYAALIGYMGVLFAGLLMSLYLARRRADCAGTAGLAVHCLAAIVYQQLPAQDGRDNAKRNTAETGLHSWRRRRRRSRRASRSNRRGRHDGFSWYEVIGAGPAAGLRR
jgi:hypothetical protein